MKVMLGNLSGIFQGIAGIINESMPIKTTYWLTRNMDKVSSEVKRFEQGRQMLLRKHTEKDKDGKMVLNKDKKSYKIKDTAEFNKEFAELAGTEIDINLKVFKLEDFGSANISINNLLKLKPIVEDLEEEKPKGKIKKDNVVKFKK